MHACKGCNEHWEAKETDVKAFNIILCCCGQGHNIRQWRVPPFVFCVLFTLKRMFGVKRVSEEELEGREDGNEEQEVRKIAQGATPG